MLAPPEMLSSLFSLVFFFSHLQNMYVASLIMIPP